MIRTRSTHTTSHITGNERGQTLLLALMILFMLVFTTGLFVTLVVRNLARAQRGGQSLSADYLAETGIRYASDQLTYSLDGADWRPVPNFPGVFSVPIGSSGLMPGKDDPDYNWLIKGFCRFTYGGGRFLIRVTYDPRLGDPISKYIKIESVGRVGIVDSSDPTTMQISQPIRLRAERVAYKAIGITDYARFITNQERRTEPFALGMPAYTQIDGSKRPFTTQYGELSDTNGDNVVEPHGGSIRVNGNLTWYGMNLIWLNSMNNEAVEVAGDITHAVEWNRSGNTPPVDASTVYVNPLLGTTGWDANPLRQSADPNFSTVPDPTSTDDIGVYRDGRPYGDVGVGTPPQRRPRGIQRLEPPLLEANGPAGGTGRYRELTRNSGEWVQSNDLNAWFNTGFYGWGKGLYINNKDDIQSESELKALRDDWMNPGGSAYWAGPYYTPPGVLIILTPYDLDGDKRQDMILMENNASGAKYNWYNRNGDIMTPTAGQMIMPYPENGIVFAEGNIRIKGTLAPHQRLTVVSAGTIYVEGSVLKCNIDDAGNPLDPSAPRDSSISLLATDYVCVNTTQFFGPAPESQTSGYWRPEIACYGASVDHPLTFNFAFGENPLQYTQNGNQVPIRAYVRHTADNGASYMEMAINQSGAGADRNNPNNLWFGLYQFDLYPWSELRPPAAPARKFMYPLADPDAVTARFSDPYDQAKMIASQKYPMWEHQTFSFFPFAITGLPAQSYTLNFFPGSNNLISFGLNQNFAKSDYLLSRFAVQPCDIIVEALMYAQNGSFYVIPGEWFNPDEGDTREGYSLGHITGRKIPSLTDWTKSIDERWPFHGDPLDVRIVIRGAISENVPAPMSDEASWMEKWGWIPSVHGSLDNNPEDQTIHYRSPLYPGDDEGEVYDTTKKLIIRQRGLSIVYDRILSYPKLPDDATGLDTAIRVDAYLRPLAITPNLPVSSQTLFFGEPT